MATFYDTIEASHLEIQALLNNGLQRSYGGTMQLQELDDFCNKLKNTEISEEDFKKNIVGRYNKKKAKNDISTDPDTYFTKLYQLCT